MNRIFTLCVALLLAVASQAQCTIDSTIQSWGFHPDTGTVLKHACLGSQYEEVVQIFAPESVTVQLGTFPVNYVQLDSMSGLPASLSYSTNPVSGYMAGGERGCISIFGLASAPVGLYEFTIHYTANFTFLGVPQSLNFRAPYKIQIDSGVATFGEFSDTTCSNNPYLFNGQWLSTGGDYNDTIANQAGCDSIVTLHLAVQALDTTVIVSGDTIIAPQGYLNYTLINCNTQEVISSGTNNLVKVAAPGIFAVIVTNGECRDTLRCVEFIQDTAINTGIDQQTAQPFAIYPTIADKVITIQTGLVNNYTLSIYNQNGMLFIQKQVSSKLYSLDIANLPTGVYIAVVNSDSVVSRGRFIKAGN